MTVPEIRTSRLLMRAWRERDREPYAALNADPVVMEHFVSTRTRAESDASADGIIASWDEHGYGLWAVERLDTGTFIGFVGLAPAEFDAWFTPNIEVGWRLAREHWGHGFATEAAKEAVRHNFEVLGRDEMVSFTAAVNVRSRRVMERIGLRLVPEGDFDHPAVPEGHPVRPHVFYRLTADDWRASQP